jgi:hypothetical protein
MSLGFFQLQPSTMARSRVVGSLSRAAHNFDYADERGHDLWPRDADFHKTSHTQGIREQKLLDAFGQKYPAYENAD